ncbi:hypothetical protein F4803DRAFT_150838 [Xylaria telfairii]|nr:hypothetical protein F4803DRAFT_150838 [Xylaria telfairii]
MPISRKKACGQCRLAKARCSLESICARCLNRGLTCEYNGGQSRSRPYTRPHFLEPERRLSLANPTVTEEPLSSLFGSSPDLGVPYLDFESGDLLREEPTLDNTQLANWEPYQMNTPREMSLDQAIHHRSEVAAHPTLTIDSPLHEARPNATLNGLPISMPTWGFIGTSQLPDTLLNGFPATISENSAGSVGTAKSQTQSDCPSSPANESEIFSDMENDTTVVIKEKRYETLRGGITTERSLMARILSSQVESYPRMLIQGSRLPPFIYPQCVLNNGLSHQCIAVNGTHQCLPEPLANCAALVRMFYSRSSNNAQFIWKAIYDEQKRLDEQSRNFDIPTLLAAIQAVVIYILMQAQDTESIAKNEVASLTGTLSEMASALHFQSQYQTSVLQNSNLSHRCWVIHESVRRTMNLFYIIRVVLIIRTRTPKRAGCSSIRETPLPCGRELWEPEATETFAIRLDRYKSRLVSNRVLVIGDLYKALGPEQSGKNDTTDSRVRKDLVTWCESLDELGTLVWMASLLDRQAR